MTSTPSQQKKKLVEIPDFEIPFNLKGRTDVGIVRIYITGTPQNQVTKVRMIKTYCENLRDVFFFGMETQ